MAKSTSIDIWIVNHYANRPGSSGLSRSYDFAKFLIKRGYSVTIICADIHYNTYDKLVDIPAGSSHLIQEIEGIRYHWIKTHPYTDNGLNRYRNIYSFYHGLNFKKLERRLGKPDVLLGSSFHPLTIWACLKYKRKTGVPFISEIRDLWPETMIQLGASKFHPAVLLMDFIQRKVYVECDQIILLFPFAHEYIQGLKIGVQRDKMTWIPNGVDVEKFHSTRISKSPVKINKRRFNIINAGSLGNVYSLEHLLGAAEILLSENLPIDIYLVGSGPLEKKLKNIKESKQLTNVHFHPSITKSEVPCMLKEFDVLYASLMESPLYKFGMSLTKLHEYMAVGKPIIFAVNAVNNPVSDSGCGLTVESNNSKEIASAIKKLYHSSEFDREVLSKKAYQYARKHFDYSALTDKLEEVIEKSIDISVKRRNKR